MTDKLLSESAWKSFAKGRDLADAPLLKALAALHRCDDDDPASRIAALNALDGALRNLHRSAKDDKVVGARLDEMDHVLQRELRDAERARAAVEAEEQRDEPDALTAALPGLVRQLRGGGTMPTMVVTLGKRTAVLISRRPISPARHTMLAAYLGESGAHKVHTGQCGFDGTTLVFIFESAPAGLAKRLRQALLDQAGLRLKVRVKAPDVDEADGADEEGDAASARAGFDTTLALVEAQLQQALKSQHPQSSKLRAVLAFAVEKADGGDLTAAGKALSTLKLMLVDAPQRMGGADSGEAAFGDALALWRAQRDAAVVALKVLAQEVAATAAAGDPDARAAVIEISAVVKQLTPDPATPQQVQELMRWIDQDDVVADVDEMHQPLRGPLLQRLQGLQQAMSGAP